MFFRDDLISVVIMAKQDTISTHLLIITSPLLWGKISHFLVGLLITVPASLPTGAVQ